MSTAHPSRRPYRRFMRWFWMLLGGYFLITAVLSLVVNPWRINRTPLSLDALDESRDIRRTVRTGKAALANQGDWQVVFFGSSRVEQAFNPEHPALEGRRAVNLAMAAASVLETVPVGHYTLDRNPDLELVLFGIDAGDLHSDFDSRKFTRFYESPFADGGLSIERGVNQVIGGRSLLDSIGTIQRHFNGEKPDRSRLGQWVEPNHPHNIREYVQYSFERGFEDPTKGWNVEPESFRQDKADLLRDFIIRVRREGIEMHLFVPTQHALKTIHPLKDRPDKMCWERDLKALAAVCESANAPEAAGPPAKLWSFLDFNRYTTMPVPEQAEGQVHMQNWYDLGHAQEEVGDAVIATLLGKTSEPVGLDLSQGSWDEVRSQWIEAHARYCVERRVDADWWRTMAKEAANRKGSGEGINE